MKPVLFLFFFGISVSACKKDHTNKADEPSVVGQWQWFRTVGLGSYETPQNTGKKMSFTFNSDFTCTRSGDLLAPSIGTFSVSPVEYPAFNLKVFLNSDTSYFFKSFESADTLVLDSGSMLDMPFYYFVRVQ